jgi:hypothetical protein
MKAVNKPIKIYSLNYLNKNCQFDCEDNKVSGTQGSQTQGTLTSFAKLCDFEPYNNNFVFSRIGASLIFSCSFKDKFGKFIVRSIDTIVLQNSNVKSMQVKYTDNSKNEVLAYELINNLKSEIRITLPQKITGSKITFNIQSVFNGKDIKIGQLRVLEKVLDLNATTETSVTYKTKDGSLRTYNGRLVTWTDYSKWAATVTAKNVAKEQYDLLKFFACRDGFITIEPFGEFEEKDIYEVYIKRSDLEYSINRWSGLFDINLKFEAQEDAAN